MFFNVALISVSLSIDALGIGVSYRLKGVSISLMAKLIIGTVSSIVMWISLFVGAALNNQLPEPITKIVGSSILILMGVIFIRNSLFGSEEASFDIDKSKKIDGFEALILGLALSADSISSGIAVATLGLGNVFIPIVVGMMQMFFLYLGCALVDKTEFIEKINKKLCGIFSGGILILIAILKGIA